MYQLGVLIKVNGASVFPFAYNTKAKQAEEMPSGQILT